MFFKNVYYSRLKSDPLGFIGRVFYKIIIGPLKYRMGDDYNAQKYWQDRFNRYGSSYKGAGDEGRTEEENKKLYKERVEIFKRLLKKESINAKNNTVLEVGCGSGYYTGMLSNLGVKNYLGVDITEVMFPELKKEFPSYRFERKDVTLDKIKGKFDLVIMIDVVEHIVNDNKFRSAMENMKDSLSKNGVFVIAPIWNKGKKHLFYLRSWSLNEIKKEFPGYTFGQLVPFTEGDLLIIRKN